MMRPLLLHAEADLCFPIREDCRRSPRAGLGAEPRDQEEGPCTLFLEQEPKGGSLRVVWDIPKGYDESVAMITAYQPDSKSWDRTYRRR